MNHAVLRASTALDLVRPARLDRVVTVSWSLGLVLAALVLWLTPWQQTAPGKGKVIAYAAEERRQNIEAPIEGRIARWHVMEGASVRKGDRLVDLVDNDPDIMARLLAERDSMTARIDAAQSRVQAISERIDALATSRENTLAGGDSRVRMAAQRTSAAEQAVALAQATLTTARLNLERQTALTEKGLSARRTLELTQLEATRAQTDLDRAQIAWEAAKAEQAAIGADRAKLDNDTEAALSDARATKAAAEAEIANATAELARLEVRRSRQATQAIVAPVDGAVLRVVANGQAGELVKAGDLLAVIVPHASERAVELWISGNDIPLIQEGADVRVQFEGWPALQFSGWPQVAVGTFPGRVKVLDAADDGGGRFRILVMPDRQSDWPAARFLRQGVRVNAWVQLGRVRLGYELWRQFNGFPPQLPMAEETAGFGAKKGEPS